MSRNLFTAAGALFALALLLSSPFIILADAQPTVVSAHVPALDTNIPFGQHYEVGNVLDYAPETYRPSGSFNDYPMEQFGYPGAVQLIFESGQYSSYPDWLTISQGTSDNPFIKVSGTPAAPGSYEIVLAGGSRDPMNPTDPPKFETEIARWTVTVAEPPPPTPYTVTFVSDPLPTSISTSAGTVTLTGNSATILEGTVMQAPELSRERQILHRWTDAAGNTYDWSKPVSSDLSLTADWREHYSVVVEGNKAIVTLSPSLPTEYTIHNVDWGDGTIDKTVNSGVSHLYAAAGDYTIAAHSRSGDWDAWVTSSTAVKVEQVTVVTYTVTFNPAGGSVVPSQTVEKGKTATEPAAPTRQGYNFTGWLKDGQRYDFSAPVTGNLYLSAGWEAVAPGGDDKDDKDEEQGHDLLLIALAVLSLVSLAITLLTRSPYAFALTIILALVELALLALGISGVIA